MKNIFKKNQNSKLKNLPLQNFSTLLDFIKVAPVPNVSLLLSKFGQHNVLEKNLMSYNMIFIYFSKYNFSNYQLNGDKFGKIVKINRINTIRDK